ncbi:MAG: hypothetical protein INF50_15335 [Rhodobacter sp.]|nr:hypothetical protein [Rhodobacter sp.]
MILGTDCDLADGAMRSRRMALRRKRGTTLVEMVLYISLVSLVMTFSIGLLREEQVRRERAAFAAEFKQVTSASQAFVGANYDQLLNTLLTTTTTNDPMIAVLPIAQVVAAGYLPQGFAGTTNPKSFVDTLNYSLVMRAVRRNDPGNILLPVAERFPFTQNKIPAIFVAGPPETFVPAWVDGDPGNDEIDLEVLLVTTGADPCVIVPAVQGPRIASQAETVAAGYVTGPGGGLPVGCPAAVTNDPAWTGPFRATGPFGAWTLPLTPYIGLQLNGDPAVQAGRLASLIALQKRPPLSEGAALAGTGDSAFRCAGVVPNTPQHLACRQSTLMFSGITFAAWDSDGDGTLDRRPGLADVHSISLAAPAGADAPAQMRNVLSLDCLGGPPVNTTWNTNKLNVNCPETRVQGLVVSQDASFSADLDVTGAVTAASANVGSAEVAGNLKLKGQDIEGWLANSDVYTFGAGPLTVPKPVCPTGYSAKMAASVMSYEATDVREQEVISTPLAGSWTVDLKLKVGNPAFNLTGATITNTNPNGAKLLVQTWCS